MNKPTNWTCQTVLVPSAATPLTDSHCPHTSPRYIVPDTELELYTWASECATTYNNVSAFISGMPYLQ